MFPNNEKVCLEPGFTGIYNRTDELGDFLPTLYSRESHTISVVRTLAFGFRQNRRALHTLTLPRTSSFLAPQNVIEKPSGFILKSVQTV